MTALFSQELELPPRGNSRRITKRINIPPGESMPLMDVDTPGCILHWWLTTSPRTAADQRDPLHDLQIRVYCDAQSEPAIDVSLAAFFAILLDKDVYPVSSNPIQVLPKNALNCYLPMPFRAIRIELQNRASRTMPIWFMANYHEYGVDQNLSNLRLRVIHRSEKPAESYGSYLMADITGRGFIAGMVHGASVRDTTDAWFHTGGDLFLLDGDSSPSALRGIGGEDVFGMSFGIWNVQAPWIGAPYLERAASDSAAGSGHEGVIYRFFGPDPIWFDTSAVARFGSKANDLESVIYAYVEPVEAPKVITPKEWLLAGPFPCEPGIDFEKSEWADNPVQEWPKTHTADFGQYQRDGQPTIFNMPVRAASEHGWCDFTRYFRGRAKTNMGTQPVHVCAYAVTRLTAPQSGSYRIRLSHDDRAVLRLDGRIIYAKTQEKGLATSDVLVDLEAGREIELRVKLSNEDNEQWRLWAFCLVLERL